METSYREGTDRRLILPVSHLSGYLGHSAAMTRFRFSLILVAFLTVGTFSMPAFSGDDDHDQARAALQRGEIKPLHEIIAMVQKAMPGEVIEVEFERDDGQWIYEIKMIGNGGRFMKIYVDAANNSIIRVKMKHAHSHRRR